MKNTEITVQVFDSFENITNILIKNGYTETEILTGEDYYFVALKPNEIKTASYPALAKSSIIIRSVSEQFSGKKSSSILYKNKIFDENENELSEEKFSINIDNVINAKKIFALSGLENWVTVKQENHFFKCGEKTIIVGKVNMLDGCFIEIEEYESIKDLSASEKIAEMKKLILSFGLNLGDDFSVKKSYLLFKKNLTK